MASPMPTLDDSIIEFVAKQTGVKRERLGANTTLFGDLGIDGIDGWEFIEEFGKRFKVDREQSPQTLALERANNELFIDDWRFTITEDLRATAALPVTIGITRK